MQKLNISSYRAQSVDGKYWFIRLFMFTLRVVVIRMSKMAHVMSFLLNAAKNQSQFGKHI